jgi:glucan 1,3-beta-glucosidase
MSAPTAPSGNVQYDPLPLTHHDTHEDRLYNEPSSPRDSTPAFHTPRGDSPNYNSPHMEPTELPEDDLPAGAAQPRFLGRAMQDELVGPHAPYATSQHSANRSMASDYNSSIYALNPDPLRGANSDFYAGGYRDDPRDSYFAGSNQDLHMSPVGQPNRYLEEKRATYASPNLKSRRKFFILGVLGVLIVLIVGVALPLYFFVFKPKHGTSTSSKSPSKPSSSGSGKPAAAIAVTGGDGSTVTLSDGTTMTYSNSFGGYWYYDETDPFNNGAKAQSWTPALNETFNYGIDKIRGYEL